MFITRLITKSSLPWVAVLTLPLMAVSCLPRNDGTELIRDIHLTAAALNDYQGAYAQDKLNKAFAISPDGAYSAGHSFPTAELAMATALLECNRRVQPGQLECLIYDVNGQVVASTPLTLQRK